jgi:hypothetical protein
VGKPRSQLLFWPQRYPTCTKLTAASHSVDAKLILVNTTSPQQFMLTPTPNLHKSEQHSLLCPQGASRGLQLKLVSDSTGVAATATTKTKRIVVMVKRMMEAIVNEAGNYKPGRESVHLSPFIPLAIRFCTSNVINYSNSTNFKLYYATSHFME